jgi:OmcA/MtrC family decaheme c-type cytochrome
VTSTVALPAGVDQFTVALEGHPAIADPFNAGQFLRVPVTNDVKYFTAAGAAGQARRTVVAVENCNKCHGVLSAHGQNRNGTTQVCVVCHNPAGTDAAQVPAGGTVEPIDFKVLVHQIHASEIKQNEVTIYGFGGSANVFPLEFPNQIGNCALCHAGTSYQLPLAAEVKDTINPAGGTTPKTIAVCTSCHDTVKFDGSAAQKCGPGVMGDCNHRGGTQTGDAQCATCHGPGLLADVAKVHPLSAPAP